MPDLKYTADGYPYYDSMDQGDAAAVAIPVDYDPFEAAAERVRRQVRNPNRPSSQSVDEFTAPGGLLDKLRGMKVEDLLPPVATAPMTMMPQIKNDLAKVITPGSGLDQLLGIHPETERYQLWPERMARSGLSIARDVATGEVPINDPATGHTNEEVIQRALDMQGLTAAGLVPGMKPGGVVGTMGGKLVQPAMKEAPALYSAAERAIETAPLKSAPAEQWLGYLKNQLGVKQEELDWLGLSDLQGKLTKEQLLEHARGHGAQVETKIKTGGDELHPDDLHDQAMESVGRKFAEENPHLRPGTARYDNALDRFLETDKGQGYLDQVTNALRDQTGGTKFSEYQLPGGTNYREMLLTLPEKKLQVDPSKWKAARNPGERDWSVHDENGKLVNSLQILAINEKDAINSAVKMAERGDAAISSDYGQRPNYKSSHWDEPNVLAHVRMNDREIPEPAGWSVSDKARFDELTERGRKNDKEAQEYHDLMMKREGRASLNSLHLEEVQSDWHQQGRKSGYDVPSANTLTDLPPGYRVSEESALRGSSSPTYAVHGPEGQIIGGRSNRQSAINEVVNALNDQRRAAQGLSGSPVLDAPFKSSWPDLALKRAIRVAAEEGKDAISWTPGAQQAARYDLSKHIDKLEYNPATGHLLGRKGGLVPIDKQGIKPEELANYVGKDAAEKLMQQNVKKSSKGPQYTVEGSAAEGYVVVGTPEAYQGPFETRPQAEEAAGKLNTQNTLKGYAKLEGLDLKVGGEGMIKFYDKMLVDKMNALAKKFGGKVEYADITPKYEIHETGAGKDKAFVVDHADATEPNFTGRTRAEAEQWIKDNSVKAPFVRITPAMRDAAIGKGFSLFSRSFPFMFEPVDHDPWEQAAPENRT